jgi:hypothetical protein
VILADIERAPTRADAYLKGLASGRSERAAEIERLRELLRRIHIVTSDALLDADDPNREPAS